MNTSNRARSRKPATLTIGLPVHNGAQYLASALQNLLAQEFEDFELLICDNASTDDTAAICRRYQRLDQRIRYDRNAVNQGAVANFNRAFALGRAPFFKWAAHDDLYHPDFLGACVRALEASPHSVLACSDAREIDTAGQPGRALVSFFPEITARKPSTRFAAILNKSTSAFPIFGVIRRDALLQTPLLGRYVGSDRILLAELALSGSFAWVDRTLFLNRNHPARSTRAIQHRHRLAWFDGGPPGRIALPYWRNSLEYLRAIHRVKPPLGDYPACLGALLHWMIHHHRQFLRDLRVFAQAYKPGQGSGPAPV